jgi:hypothetical protein
VSGGGNEGEMPSNVAIEGEICPVGIQRTKERRKEVRDKLLTRWGREERVGGGMATKRYEFRLRR